MLPGLFVCLTQKVEERRLYHLDGGCEGGLINRFLVHETCCEFRQIGFLGIGAQLLEAQFEVAQPRECKIELDNLLTGAGPVGNDSRDASSTFAIN